VLTSKKLSRFETLLMFNSLASIAKLPKWFGERPGKKAGDPETPEGEEDAKVAEEEEVEEEEVEEKPVRYFFVKAFAELFIN